MHGKLVATLLFFRPQFEEGPETENTVTTPKGQLSKAHTPDLGGRAGLGGRGR